MTDYRIVHHARHSPRQPEGNCYTYSERSRSFAVPLDVVLGTEGLIFLLSLIDAGPSHEPDYRGPRVVNLREWAELFRRLHVPYYEEAREHFPRAIRAGFFKGDSEQQVYSPERLVELIHRYEKALR